MLCAPLLRAEQYIFHIKLSTKPHDQNFMRSRAQERCDDDTAQKPKLSASHTLMNPPVRILHRKGFCNESLKKHSRVLFTQI